MVWRASDALGQDAQTYEYGVPFVSVERTPLLPKSAETACCGEGVVFITRKPLEALRSSMYRSKGVSGPVRACVLSVVEIWKGVALGGRVGSVLRENPSTLKATVGHDDSP